MPTTASAPQNRHTGRHRRARLSWWRMPQPGTAVEVTVTQLQRRWERERAYANRARRVLVIPRQHPTPNTPATDPNTAPYQGPTRG